jgi:hypothetical protein
MQRMKARQSLRMLELSKILEVKNGRLTTQSAKQKNALAEPTPSELTAQKLFDARSGIAAANQLPRGLRFA